MAGSQDPHQRRDLAESFGSDAARYDRTRPTYPDAMIHRIVGLFAAASPQDLEILDVGCGTGIVARQLRAAGCRVRGVEVDARMADFAQRDGFDVEVTRFEDWDPAGRLFDAVLAGQTWHWIDPVAGAKKAAKALRPGGWCVLFWNAADPEPKIRQAFASGYKTALPGTELAARVGGAYGSSRTAAQGYGAFLDAADAGIRRSGSFGVPERWRFDWQHSYARDEWLDVVPTQGGHQRLSHAESDSLLGTLGDAVDRAGGRFVMRYTTLVILARRAAVRHVLALP